MIDYKTPADFIKRVAAECKGGRAMDLLLKWLPGGKKEGNEWVALNPTRGDKSRGSFRVNIITHAWGDFATSDAGGDFVSLHKYLTGAATMLDAAKDLANIIGFPNPYEMKSASSKPTPKFNPPPKEYAVYRHPNLGIPHEVYIFRREPKPDGSKGSVVVVECVFRKNTIGKNGKQWKSVRPYSPELKQQEQNPWYLPRNDRPLFNLTQILESKAADLPLLFVEGAKTALFLKRLLVREYGDDINMHPFVPTTWSGGRALVRVQECDFSHVAGRKVFVSPDCDEPGRQTGGFVSDMCIKNSAREVLILDAGNRPRGWDLADYTHAQDGEWLVFWDALKGTALRPADYRSNKTQREMASLETRGVVKPVVRPFVALGFEDAEDKQMPSYHFYTATTQRVIKLGPKDFVEKMLVQLAPYNYWAKQDFGGNETRGINWSGAGYQVMEECAKMGVVDTADIRYGRGCWRSGDEIIIHAGDRLLKNGVWLKPIEACIMEGKHSQRMLFEAEKSIDLDEPIAAEREDIDTLMQMAERMSFKAGKLAGHILVGWSVASVFCGVFSWRPHLCLTGAPSSGKTTAMRDIACLVQGDFAIGVEGATTEAGLRRALGISARPTRFDELEASEVRGDKRQEKILRLARSASTESGGRIRHGDSRSYLIRTMMMANAVNFNLTEEADRQRWFVLEMSSNSGKTRNEQIKWKSDHERLLHTLPDNFWARIFWLVYSRRKAFLSALHAFQSAGTSRFGTMRMGEQVAPVMAALYTLLEAKDDTENVSVFDALGFLNRYDTWDIIFEDSSASDFEEMIGYLQSVRMESGITIGYALGQLSEWEMNQKPIDPGLHRLALKSPGRDGDDPMPEWEEEFTKELGTYGFAFSYDKGKGVPPQVIISNGGCSPLEKQLANSRWAIAKTRRDIIRQETSTKSLPQPYYFKGWGVATRASAVDLALMRANDPEVFELLEPQVETTQDDDELGSDYP